MTKPPFPVWCIVPALPTDPCLWASTVVLTASSVNMVLNSTWIIYPMLHIMNLCLLSRNQSGFITGWKMWLHAACATLHSRLHLLNMPPTQPTLTKQATSWIKWPPRTFLTPKEPLSYAFGWHQADQELVPVTLQPATSLNTWPLNAIKHGTQWPFFYVNFHLSYISQADCWFSRTLRKLQRSSLQVWCSSLLVTPTEATYHNLKDPYIL